MIQQLAGHASLVTAQRYMHLSPSATALLDAPGKNVSLRPLQADLGVCSLSVNVAALHGKITHGLPLRSPSALRAIGLGLVTLGLVAGAGPSAGCLYPDHCIQVGISGTRTCLLFNNASALDEEGQVVGLILDGFSPPRGCDCLRDSEVELLESGDVESLEYQQLYFGLEAGAREDCLQLALEQGILNPNCLSAEIVATTIATPEVPCTAGCFYSNPPLGKECPECVLDDDTVFGETGGHETGGEDTGTETGSAPPVLPRLQLRSRR